MFSQPGATTRPRSAHGESDANFSATMSQVVSNQDRGEVLMQTIQGITTSKKGRNQLVPQW